MYKRQVSEQRGSPTYAPESEQALHVPSDWEDEAEANVEEEAEVEVEEEDEEDDEEEEEDEEEGSPSNLSSGMCCTYFVRVLPTRCLEIAWLSCTQGCTMLKYTPNRQMRQFDRLHLFQSARARNNRVRNRGLGFHSTGGSVQMKSGMKMMSHG